MQTLRPWIQIAILSVLIILTVIGAFAVSSYIHEILHLHYKPYYNNMCMPLEFDAICVDYTKDSIMFAAGSVVQGTEATRASHFRIYFIQGVVFGVLAMLALLLLTTVVRYKK